MLQESGLGIPPSLSNHLNDIKTAVEDRDDLEDDLDEDNDREDSDPEDHPEDHEMIKEEMKRENFGDFKSPFGMTNSSSATNTTMSSIMLEKSLCKIPALNLNHLLIHVIHYPLKKKIGHVNICQENEE